MADQKEEKKPSKLRKRLIILAVVVVIIGIAIGVLAIYMQIAGKYTIEYTLSDDGTYYIVSKISYESGIVSDSDVVIPEEHDGLPVKEIGSDACSGTQGGVTSITSLTIPDSVTKIGYSAFSGCRSLVTLEIPDSVILIDTYAFRNCYSLVEVTIGSGVQAIGPSAFGGCDRIVNITNLSSLGIRAGSETIGQSGSLLSSLGVHKIGSGTWDEDWYSVDVGWLANEVYSSVSEESRLVEENNFLFVYSGNEYFLVNYMGMDTAITLPSTINGKSVNYKIYRYALSGNGQISTSSVIYNHSDITSVVIPSNVTAIGEYAFYSLSNLTSVTFETTVGWHVEDSDGNTNSVSTLIAETNATNLRLTYCSYYWYKG